MSKHIWYSGATDITGKALAEALNLTGTKTKPGNIAQGDIILGWGTKTKENVNLGRATVLNHPDKIRANRNKLKSLQTMFANADLKASIATFCTADDVIRKLGHNQMKLPLVGRTKFHQGGKGFWLCLTKQHVEKAIADGAQYFQTYIDIKDEYRLHVAFGSVIYAVKKVENANEAGWIAQRKEKILDYAKKNNVNMNDDTLDYVLKRMVKEAILPDRIVRSNRRGWKFSNIRLANLIVALKNAAVKAVEVSGLDFGAVDCAISADGLPYIIEINSGPGLQGTALQKYIDIFTAKLNALRQPAKAKLIPKAVAAVGKAVKNAVGAEGAVNNADNPIMNAGNAPAIDGGLALLMRNVKTDEQAEAVIAALIADQRQKQGE
jgi:glutathione synthase/RimK-type ligase-like ATP-grasp enzyme